MLFEFGGIGSHAVTDKATQIMDKMLLTYLTNKPNMREFMLAFVSEMDFLLEQINEVYFGRFIADAVGEQLDTIGIILQQNRRIVLSQVYFGFQGASGLISGMADESSPALGGIFKSEEEVGGTAPLSDANYKRLLLVKAACMNSKSNSINRVYYFMQLLLGFSPSYMKLHTLETDNLASPITNKREVILELDIAEVTPAGAALAQYASRYFVPAGTSFTINLESR